MRKYQCKPSTKLVGDNKCLDWVIYFEETDVAEMDWSYVSPLHFGALLIGVLPPRVTKWHISCTHEMPPHVEEMSDYLSHNLSHENKHAVPLTWDLQCVRLGARIWWFPPPRCVWFGALKKSSSLYSRVLFKSVFLSGIKSIVVTYLNA